MRSALALRALIDLSDEMLCVDDRDDGIELRIPTDVIVDEERLRHRRRIGKPGGFDDDPVELPAPFHKSFQNPDEIASNGAANAPVVHLKYLLVGVDDQIIVDSDLAEFIHDDGVALAMRLGQNAIEQRRLSRTEVSGENGNGSLSGGVAHSLSLFSFWGLLHPESQGRIRSAPWRVREISAVARRQAQSRGH